MTISAKKTPILFDYEIDSLPLNRVSSMKDLGIIVDHKLLFSEHIHAIKSKAMSLLGLLYRFIDITSTKALQSYFSSIVLPVITYCSPIWSMSASTNLATLNSVTTFFAKIVKYRNPILREAPTSTVLSSLSLPSLSRLRLQSDIKFIFNALNSHFDSPDILSFFNIRVPSRHTRSTSLLHMPTPRLSVIKRSLFHRLSYLINSLPGDIDPFSLTIQNFTQRALKYLTHE